MASLSAANRSLKLTSKETIAVPIKDSEAVYIGGYYAIDDGYITELTDAAGKNPAGILVEFSDLDTGDGTDTGSTSASPVPEGVLDIGGGVVKEVTVTGATSAVKVGSEVHLTGDNLSDLTLTSTTTTPAVGLITRWYSGTTCDVLLYPLSRFTKV